MKQSLRVGIVPYLVGKPLSEGLEKNPQLAITWARPSELVEGLRTARFDVALASSIELFRLPGASVIPGLAIACDGEVQSVRLFHRLSFFKIRSIAQDPASQTGVALSRIVANEWRESAIEWIKAPPEEDVAKIHADAYLRIGDRALQEMHLGEIPSLDLGKAWKDMTGLPFVFALWIVRPGLQLGSSTTFFQEAAKKGLARREEFAQNAAQELNLPQPLLRRYLLESCRYSLGNYEERGLLEFASRAAALDLCQSNSQIRFTQ